MEENDDWKLGDEGEATSCPRCGKRNRAGLTQCVICGSRLGDELEADPGSLRNIGEAMGGERRVRRVPARHSLRAWSIAVAVLLLVVVVLTWLQTRDEPFRLEDLKMPVSATPPPPPLPTIMATQVVVPTKRPAPPSPIATAVPPEPTVVLTATPLPPSPRPVATVRPRRVAAPTVVRPAPTPYRAPVVKPANEPSIGERPRREATEKPSLGTDLQDATRAYRQAVEVHNARVDEYNALADEIQRRDAFDDSQGSVELRRRLDRARAAVESARVNAETLRTRMESVRAQYR